VLFRLGELVAHVEGAGSMARRAAAAAEGRLPEKASRRFAGDALEAMSRVYAREVAMRVATQGLTLVVGAAATFDHGDLAAALRLPAIHAAQAELAADMDRIADVIYGRPPAAAAGPCQGVTSHA